MEQEINQRWYDSKPKIRKAIEVIEELSRDDQEVLSESIIQLINVIRAEKEDEENTELVSLGKDRTLGLYKAFNKRRLYDKNYALMSAMNILATMSIEDCENIAEGILITLKQN